MKSFRERQPRGTHEMPPRLSILAALLPGHWLLGALGVLGLLCLAASSASAQAPGFRMRSANLCPSEKAKYDALRQRCSTNAGSWTEQGAVYRAESNPAIASMSASDGTYWSTKMLCQHLSGWAQSCGYPATNSGATVAQPPLPRHQPPSDAPPAVVSRAEPKKLLQPLPEHLRSGLCADQVCYDPQFGDPSKMTPGTPEWVRATCATRDIEHKLLYFKEGYWDTAECIAGMSELVNKNTSSEFERAFGESASTRRRTEPDQGAGAPSGSSANSSVSSSTRFQSSNTSKRCPRDWADAVRCWHTERQALGSVHLLCDNGNPVSVDIEKCEIETGKCTFSYIPENKKSYQETTGIGHHYRLTGRMRCTH
ncbi:MAG: hypothetical protein KIT48_07980 [Pseudolabrys sp.]|nr:hypothetical protein [Pseudolabrys sp.]